MPIDWLVINQANTSISIFTSQVKSVHEYIIWFNAKLITFALNQYNSSKIITDDYYVSINFSNNNWVVFSTNATYYVVIDQLSIFSLDFYDQENDNILLILKNYDQIGLYWRQDSISNQKLILFLQANTYSEDQIQIVVTYTDSYHQDPSFYQNFTISVYSFLVDPPSFENNLETFHADRWSNYTIMLPNISDPNKLDYSVSINQPYPDWVQLSNNTLYLNTADKNFHINETTIVILKIMNSMKAWREYNQTIVTDPYLRPSFAFMQNISVSDNNLHEINIDVVSSFEVDAIDWISSLSIGWISFKDHYSKMYIYYPYQIEIEKWVELRSYDSCKIAVYSSKFYILSNAKYPLPPSIWNSFGPIKVYVGNKSLFLIPTDLFRTQNNSKLEYSASVVNWSNHSPLIISINEASFGCNYLFVLSNEEKSCQIIIRAVDLYYQSSEILVNVDVISWASKDWVSCENEYQSGWTKWKLNYILDESGSWILNKSFYPSSINSIIDMWGIITLTCLLAQLLMSIRLGFNTLQSIEFSQAILIIFTLFYQNDIDLNQYASWIQFFKLDFGFLDFLKLRNLNIGKIIIY